MKYVTLTAFALFSILAQGCVVDADEPMPENRLPLAEAPAPLEGDEPVHPIEEAPAPDEADGEDNDLDIAHPIARGPGPDEEDEDDGEWLGGHGVDGGDAGEDGEEAPPGVFGGDDGEGEEEDGGEDLEIRGECEPGQDECDLGFACEETCKPSFCDDEGRCTMDCQIVYACVGNDPIPR